MNHASALLLVTRDFQVLGWRGDAGSLLPLDQEATPPAKLPGGPAGTTIRLLIDGVEQGRLQPETVLDVPAAGGKPPLRISVMPAGEKTFAVMVEPVREYLVHALEERLKSTEECLRTTVEDYEAATEELKCSYEELRTANEQLQITAEDLNHSHAAMAAIRDRLEAVNRNLQIQHARLQRRFDEFLGLVNSLGLPVILLGNDLRVRFFNRQAERLFHLASADEGLHLSSLETTVALNTLATTCAFVLDHLAASRAHHRRFLLLHPPPD